MQKTIDLEATKQKFNEFVHKMKTVTISSLDENGDPFISYAPYVNVGDKLYIYISQISDHYKYVEDSSYVHVMLIADETLTPNKFARERARFKCTTTNLGNEGHEGIFAAFDEQHGQKMMEMLRGLDFSLFELVPVQGRYVIGFGQAFDVSITGEQFSHVVVDKKKS
ncbi:heme iron utilization protein [Paenibacillus selenitireducens]|uniref:Heme iron utilization protein n=1 Tax=Paenibacillus selenitireducens TaxID=1324314 RepID=A0A1T2X8N7_9BACL|nr:pyridoxamine 5'-phosphate oxidase family protein [Paenibacillus selenitireducens]OPA76212.1 heme iron utilization protein [Paenibacillus selenitireducens]